MNNRVNKTPKWLFIKLNPVLRNAVISCLENYKPCLDSYDAPSLFDQLIKNYLTGKSINISFDKLYRENTLSKNLVVLNIMAERRMKLGRLEMDIIEQYKDSFIKGKNLDIKFKSKIDHSLFWLLKRNLINQNMYKGKLPFIDNLSKPVDFLPYSMGEYLRRMNQIQDALPSLDVKIFQQVPVLDKFSFLIPIHVEKDLNEKYLYYVNKNVSDIALMTQLLAINQLKSVYKDSLLVTDLSKPIDTELTFLRKHLNID